MTPARRCWRCSWGRGDALTFFVVYLNLIFFAETFKIPYVSGLDRQYVFKRDHPHQAGVSSRKLPAVSLSLFPLLTPLQLPAHDQFRFYKLFLYDFHAITIFPRSPLPGLGDREGYYGGNSHQRMLLE